MSLEQKEKEEEKQLASHSSSISKKDSDNDKNKNNMLTNEKNNITQREVINVLNSVFDNVLLKQRALEPMIEDVKSNLFSLLSHPLFAPMRSVLVEVLQGMSSDMWLALLSNSRSSSSAPSASAFSFTQLECKNASHIVTDDENNNTILIDNISLRQKFMLLFVIYCTHRAHFIAAANELVRDYLDSDKIFVEKYISRHKKNNSRKNDETEHDNKNKESISEEKEDEEERNIEQSSHNGSVSPTLSHITNTMTNLREIIVTHHELTNTIPLLCITNTNADPAVEIDECRRECGVAYPLYTVAMGSKESVFSAQRALQSAMQYGGWVLLQNVHYDVHFLDDIEKRMYSAKHDVSCGVHDGFRLFLTAE